MSYPDEEKVREAIERARERLGLGSTVPVYSCYEAGRDGFWVHRLLEKLGVENMVIDPASVEVDRRRRRAKTDRLDARKLLVLLMRYHQFKERQHCRVVHVPGQADEDARRPHRELERLKKERTGHANRIRALLATQGIRVGNVMKVPWERLRDWQGNALGAALLDELKREMERLEMVCGQIGQVEGQRQEALKEGKTKAAEVAAKLHRLKSVGPVSASTLSHEFFAWRRFKNVRQVSGLSGLTGTPHDSGQSRREQGIGKAGNARVRRIAIELAWTWLRYQPESELSQWYRRRFALGGARMRKVGIVALARKLLVALWKWVDQDQLPAGALLKE